MGNDEMITSAFLRFLKLGGLMGRVGGSMLGAHLADLARLDVSGQVHTTEAMIRNARRVVETLGQMKGAAMKVGQMLSLHEGLLPPEVAEVLRALQKEAPRVPPEVMEYEVRGQLKNFDDLFEELDLDAFAAASIGQVHRGRLKDGRRVAVKIQYPGIDHIIKADLKNLRALIQGLFALFSKIDFAPVWREVRDRLLEELDYHHEAENIRRMAQLHAAVPEIVIPAVVEEASARGVLTMEYVRGIPAEEACGERYDQALRDRWGAVLFELQLRGILEHRLLHADPNLANFSFLEDGRVIVYDFGCVKVVPEKIATGYAALLRAVLDERGEEIPRILLELGVFKGEGVALPSALTDPYFEMFGAILRDEPPYTFGGDDDLYRRLFSMGMADLPDAMEIHFPQDVVFIDRSLGGHFGNLSRLRASGPWRTLARKHLKQ